MIKLAVFFVIIVLLYNPVSGLSVNSENNLSDKQAVVVSKNLAHVIVDVEGLVCDFCAQGLIKVFNKQKEIDEIKVDFDQSTLSIYMIPSQNMTDESIETLIQGNGFTVTQIRRF